MLKDTVPGKHPVTKRGFQYCPAITSRCSQLSFTNACLKRNRSICALAWAKKSPSMSPEVLAPKALGPVMAPLSLDCMARKLKLAFALTNPIYINEVSIVKFLQEVFLGLGELGIEMNEKVFASGGAVVAEFLK